MPNTEKSSAEAQEVRRLAGEGLLTSRYRDGSDDERRRLRAGAAEIAAPLIFLRVTRPIERKRGHHRCAAGLRHLAHDCLERFHDDVDAVLDDLFARANLHISNLEGWLTMRMPRATVDGYRRRRGQRGAPQKPRVPMWLATALGDDAWLVVLAKAVLDWAGADATAGGSLWPLTTWAEWRATLTGDHTMREAAVAEDVETVLAAMRRRLSWYEKNVEGPLGRKPAPVWFTSRTTIGDHAEPEPFALVAPHEQDDALLRELAAAAIDLITVRLDRGEEADKVVLDVLGAVFGEVPTSYGLNRPPDAGDPGPGQVTALITDPARLDQIVATVIDLVNARDPGEHAPSSTPDRPSERSEATTDEGTAHDAMGRRHDGRPAGVIGDEGRAPPGDGGVAGPDA